MTSSVAAGHPSRRALPSAWSATRVVAASLIVCAFAAYRVWQAFAGPLQTWSDSTDYARSAIWAGRRPPLMPAVLGVTGISPGFVALQLAVAVVAWVVLAVALGAVVPLGARIAVIAAVLGIASTTAVAQWDRSVLSESLSLSAMALLLAAGIWAYSGVFTWPRVLALTAAAALFASVRDPHIWVVWLLAAFVGVEAVIRARGARGLVAALGLALCAGAMLGGSLDAGRAQPNVEHVYFVRVFPYADRVEWFEEHGMPNGDRVRRYARGTVSAPGAAPVVSLDAGDQTVRPLLTWLREHGLATYVRWLLEHPWLIGAEPFEVPERAYNFADGDLSFYAMPDRTELSPVDAVFHPPAVVVVIVGSAALLIGLTSDLRRRGWWWFLVAFGALGVVHMLVAWHGDGMETTRHVSVGNVQLRVAVVALAVVAWTRRPPRARPFKSGDAPAGVGSTWTTPRAGR